jgi:hypothetical protein
MRILALAFPFALIGEGNVIGQIRAGTMTAACHAEQHPLVEFSGGADIGGDRLHRTGCSCRHAVTGVSRSIRCATRFWS